MEGERRSVGYRGEEAGPAWKTERIPLSADATAVITTDGITDQVGGPRGIALGRRRLSAVVRESQSGGPTKIKDGVAEALRTWQGSEARRDDVTLLAFRRGGLA